MQEHPAPNDEADRPRNRFTSRTPKLSNPAGNNFSFIVIFIFTGQRQLGDLLSSSLHLSLLIGFIVKRRLV